MVVVSFLRRIIVDKIDTNRDGKVSPEELSAWINKVSKNYVYDDVERMWDYHDTDHDGFVNLDEHKEVYGVVDSEWILCIVFFKIQFSKTWQLKHCFMFSISLLTRFCIGLVPWLTTRFTLTLCSVCVLYSRLFVLH